MKDEPTPAAETSSSRTIDPGESGWHALPTDEVVAAALTHEEGLSSAEVAARLGEYGPNSLPTAPTRSLAAVFVSQFKSPLIYLLFAAAGIALSLGETNDAIVIFCVVTLNAVIGAFQEGRAERSLHALRKLATHSARVARDGEQQLVEASDLVPGDILVLEAGDAVTADARLLQGASLQIAEAALTGESVPVAKNHVPVAPETPLADRSDMVYAGTHVTAGRARAVVVTTGRSTEIGRIAALAESAEEPQTPLERRVEQFGNYIMIAAAAMFATIMAVGLVRGIELSELIMVCTSQVVGMIPEGLPVAMTIALAVGVQRMARRRAVVRRLAAVETLGSTTVICSDKTGTLTRNEMTVTAIHLADGRDLTVEGVGYAPRGDLLCEGTVRQPQDDAALRCFLEGLILCNDARLSGPRAEEPRWQPLGDPTEVALLTLAMKAGLVPSEVRAEAPRRAELPFDPSEKMMATQHDVPGGRRVFIKGAPEVVLAHCHTLRRDDDSELLDDAGRDRIRLAADSMAERALRVLAVAVVDDGEIDGGDGFAAFAGKATFLGMVGQLDPPREEVRDAVRECKAAGIRPVMVTGDHRVTGLAIAKTLGISEPGDLAVDGRELAAMSDEALAAKIDRISVFARVHPAQKLRIVESFQAHREVVAMTGDGVNDAPALVRADVGVAMGQGGTEVAKEAAEIVISDDNFATIVSAVEEGRVAYRNIKKVVLYLFSTSIAEVMVLLFAILLGYPPPLAAVQILWINLVTEGSVTVTLIMEPPEGDEMQRAPTPHDERLLSRDLLRRMLLMAPTMTLSTLGWFIFRQQQGVPFAQVQTETFTVLAVCQWFNVLNCRSEITSAFRMPLFRNPWLVGGLVLSNLMQIAVVFWPPLSGVFHTVPFDLGEVLAIGAVASAVLWVEELRKLIARRR